MISVVLNANCFKSLQRLKARVTVCGDKKIPKICEDKCSVSSLVNFRINDFVEITS